MATGKIIEAMIEYYGTDLKRVNHFLKVFAIAKTIGEGEGLCTEDLELLEAAAVVHDIGIKLSEKKYNSSAGKYQEIEGPNEAKKLLLKLGYEEKFIDKVCYLVAHHHTYSNIDTLPYQYLVEADFLVNLDEDNERIETVKRVEGRIFRSKIGKKLLNSMYFTR